MSGNNSKLQKMDLIYVRAQVKITKYGFFMSNRGPDKEQNIKIWIKLCPGTSQNRKRWQLCLMDEVVVYGTIIKAYTV